MRVKAWSAYVFGLSIVVLFGAGSAVTVGRASPVVGAQGEKTGSTRPRYGAKAGKDVLYLSSLLGSHVAIYDQRGSHQQVGDITQGIDQPFGVFVDRSLNLYVANFAGADVTVYPPGGTSPSRTLTGVPAPQDLVVAKDGTVYVATYSRHDHSPYGPSAVVAYAPGASSPTSTVVTFHNRFASLAGVALDATDNLYVAYNRPCIGCRDHQGNSVGEVLEIKAGSTQTSDLGIRVDSATAITVDRAGNLLLLARNIFKNNNDFINVYLPGSRKPMQRIDLGFNEISPTAIALDRANKNVWVVFPGGSASRVLEVAYPSGTLGAAIRSVPYCIGIAASPQGSE